MQPVFVVNGRKEGSDEGKETQVEKQVRRCAHGEVMDAQIKPRFAMGNCNMNLQIKSRKVTLMEEGLFERLSESFAESERAECVDLDADGFRVIN